MLSAPTIETQRLRLRHHRLEDFEAMADLFASERSVYMGGPISRGEIWRWLAAEVGSWSLLGYGSWAVETLDGGATIGQVGVNKPAQYPEIELGWVLYEEFEGKGYAFEAAMAARDWAYSTGGVDELVSYITPGNDRSVALAQRMGAVLDPLAPLPSNETRAETDVYRHPSAADLASGGVEAYA